MAQPNFSHDDRYPISITSRHFEITKPIENYVFEKVYRVDRMAGKVHHVRVVLDAQKMEYSCSILMTFLHFNIKVHASAPDDMYKAIDACSDKLFNLITRYKDKMIHHHAKPAAEVDIEVNVIRPYNDNLTLINEEIKSENARREYERTHLHEIVAKETVSVKTHTQGEAIMRMEFSREPFMIYRSEEDQKLKVLYRRDDDNYNLVQIQ